MGWQAVARIPYKQKIRWKNHRTSCCTPSGARLRYLQLRNRVLNIDIPPKSPFGKGGLCQGSRQRYINKKSDGKTIGLLVVPPQGLARRALARWSGDTFENKYLFIPATLTM